MTSIEIKSLEEFQKHMASNELVYVDFWKDNCPNCKMLDLSFQEFKNSDHAEKVKVLKVKLEEMGENFFFDQDIRQTPTLVLYRGGEELTRLNGFIPPNKIEEALVAEA
ncbi:thioredoxin [Listeria fleischmannii 1991]|uniref:Thioredoxin n=3 Tax=Listeria fleischmannii TaxID=1069827 RepID=A0A2X3GH57_9LIST|nr:thioredoxin family protein [Listeria fleischmannii]EIA20353.1 thioredoxin, putative [Listeria fleischmannii subsp. coloradonensis]EMG28673.1 thioredoxin [Listeria fleischmannii subsp. fleischmannii LU2006-1]KMT59550.1 thioredoxin [Listeria fleischmannii 1991]MBC1398352.1 thioredoxin family protein [Listeria fleischmannii]MBC1418681.1 thioredoxin family protein [Listeria fleischmannii]